MTRYFFAWLTCSFVWCIGVLLFDGLATRESTYITALVSLGIGVIAYFLYPRSKDPGE